MAGDTGADRARVPYLDAARGWAIGGVVLVHSLGAVPGPAADPSAGEDVATAVVTSVTTVLFQGASRALLALLLGIGLVLSWRSHRRRGGNPLGLLARRYGALFVLGLPHWALFRPDILTHYALVVLAALPLLPWLLGGRRRRPLLLAAACVPLHGLLAVLLPGAPGWPFDVVKMPSTLLVLAVGVWLARLPGFDLDGSGPAVPAGRRARRTAGWGLVVVVGGAASIGLGLLVLVPYATGPEPPPLVLGLLSALLAMGITALGLGRALVCLAVVRWLAERGREGSRVCGALAPLGRSSLTVYLGSTVVFVVGGSFGRLPAVVWFVAGLAYLVVTAVAARLWLRRFGHGPAEWLWRRLAHVPLRPARRVVRPTAPPVSADPTSADPTNAGAGSGSAPGRDAR